MRSDINRCIICEADYIIAHKATVRKCAKAFCIGKSTVHKDMLKLKNIDFDRYSQVRKILNQNFNERHSRGGAAIRLKRNKCKANLNNV